MDKKRMVSVNELREILKKHFKEQIHIIGVDVADATHQWDPHHFDVNVGGVLNIHLEVYEDKKASKNG